MKDFDMEKYKKKIQKSNDLFDDLNDIKREEKIVEEPVKNEEEQEEVDADKKESDSEESEIDNEEEGGTWVTAENLTKHISGRNQQNGVDLMMNRDFQLFTTKPDNNNKPEK